MNAAVRSGRRCIGLLRRMQVAHRSDNSPLSPVAGSEMSCRQSGAPSPSSGSVPSSSPVSPPAPGARRRRASRAASSQNSSRAAAR